METDAESTSHEQASGLREDYGCPLCHELLFEPCIPPCGHPFCRDCLAKLLQHASARAPGVGSKCPVCRRVLHTTRVDNLAICSHFDRLIEFNFPEEYAQRRAASKQAGNQICSNRSPAPQEREWLPLFVLDPTLPGQHLHLNIFEPRYTAMVRRVLEGNRCFGMVGRGRGGEPAQSGVEVRLLSAAEQFDGRFLVEIVGQRSFKVLQMSIAVDGLTEAEVEFIDLESGSTEGDGAQEAAAAIPPLVEEWQAAVRNGGWERQQGHLAMVLEHLGPMPPCERPGSLASWTAALINPLPALGVAPEVRPAILSAATPLERVQIAQEGLRCSLNYLKAAHKFTSWQIWKLVPVSVRPFLPALVLLTLALVLPSAPRPW